MNTYGTAYITEANECHPNFIQEVFDRTLSSPDRKIFHDLNPKAESHWYYTDLLDFHERKQAENPDYGYNYGHFTIADNMSISDSKLREVLATYDKTSIWYARDILGQRRIAEGLVYPMFDANRHVVSEVDWQGVNYVSIDYGTVNPTVFGLWRLHRGKATMVKEYYFDSRAEKKQKTDEMYHHDLLEFIGDLKIEYIVVDPSAASFKECIRSGGKYNVINADNDVINGIRFTATLLQSGRLFFHESCENMVDEFGAYMWDDKAVDDAVIKDFDHCLTGDTLVDTVDGQVRIDELVGKCGYVYCLSDEGPTIETFRDVRMTMERAEVFEIELEDGRKINATGEHPILTKRGWIRVENLQDDDEVVCIGG